MQYYQVDNGPSDDDAEDDDLSQDEKGVKGHYEGSHSPFGLIYQIARDTGWTVEYILSLPHATLVMMLADAPKYVSGTTKEKEVQITSKEQLYDLVAGKF